MAFVHDQENERIVFFGGDGGSIGPCDLCFGETWALELGTTPERWVRLNAGTEPEARRNGAYVLDPW